MFAKHKHLPLFTIGLIIINTLVFFAFSYFGISDTTGGFIDFGGLFWPYVLYQQEYYRLFTSMFIHFSINHLINNMVMLGVLGQAIEVEKGRIQFLIVYFIGGLGGSFLSLMFNYRNNFNVVSGGASGAIFALMGALLAYVARTRRPMGRLSSRGMLLCIALSLYIGFTSGGIDNAAHIGGLIVGFIVGLLLSFIPKRNRSR